MAADVWSVTSYNESAPRRTGDRSLEPPASYRGSAGSLYREGARRRGRARDRVVGLHEGRAGPAHAVDRRQAPTLGTDGFGRSENREHLRRFFEISAEAIAQTTLAALAREGKIDAQRAAAAIAELGFDREKPDPSRA